MNFKALTLAAVTAAVSIAAAPAAEARKLTCVGLRGQAYSDCFTERFYNPYVGEPSGYQVDAAHKALIDAVTSTGVKFKINPKECFGKNVFGWYWSRKNEMVVCQERKERVGVETSWTDEDLDTLRHETQHLTQDCMDGSQNGSLGSVYKDPFGLAKRVLSQNQIEWIIKIYSEDGASNHMITLELEAFSVAAMNDPAEQVRDIQKYCF